MTDDPYPDRPRFGKLIRRDGTAVLLVFHTTDDRRVFVARRADTQEPIQVEAGDKLKVDMLAAGQTVTFDGGTRKDSS